MSSEQNSITFVPIKVYIKDNLEPKNKWQLGVWDYNEHAKTWGLLHYESPTQMSYMMSPNPFHLIVERRIKYTRDSNMEWTRWYFDVGRKLYVVQDDLEVALWDIGIRPWK